MNSDFFKGFLAARGVQLPDASLDMNQYEEAMTEAVRKHVMDLDAQIATLKAQLSAANQKLAQAGQGQVPAGPATVANSALANSADAEAARLALDGEARKLEATGMSYADAFTAARVLRPDLAQRASARPALAIDTIPPFPGKTPAVLEALGLPADADTKLFDLAWTATRGKVAPADSLAIFRQVRAWLAGFKGISSDAAEAQIEQDFPVLYQRAQAAQKAVLENSLVANPRSKALLGIPADASLDEFAAAVEGNGRMLSPRNARGIWEALLKWLAKERGRGTAGVEKEAAQRYPEIAAELGIYRA